MRLHKDILPGAKSDTTLAHAKVMRNWYMACKEMPTQGAFELGVFRWVVLKNSSPFCPVRMAAHFMGHLQQRALRGVESRVDTVPFRVLILLEVLNWTLPLPRAACLGDVLVEVVLSKRSLDTVILSQHYRLSASRAGTFDSRPHVADLDMRLSGVEKLLVRRIPLDLLGLYLRSDYTPEAT